MDSQSTMHAYLEWAKQRADEIDATLVTFEKSVAQLEAGVRAKAESAMADMRAARDAFRKFINEHGETNEAALARSQAALETQWTAFEASVQAYLDATGKQVTEQEIAFRARADAQYKAWEEAIDKLHKSATSFAADRRHDIETAVKRMKTEADASKVKLDKLKKAGGESWDAMKSALTETRAALDRAQQAVRDAFKRAI
jgi:hypothetical protein